MAAREENILNVPLSETLEGMHVLCDTGSTGEPYRVAASLFIAEATQAAKDAVANLDPGDIILKGFSKLTAGKPAITASSTLLAAIQSLYAMVGSGKVKIVSDGADQTGMVCWNGTSASGFVINVNEAAIYTRSQWTQASPDSVTDANWIAAVKTGGTKTPFAAAAQNPNMGDLPTNSRLKFVDNKGTIQGMLKMLTAAANIGRLRIVSANPGTAETHPEMAFFVNPVQGVDAETKGTTWIQCFHFTNDYAHIIPSNSININWATLQTMTDADVIAKLNSTASGDWGGLGVKMKWNQSSMPTVEITDFAVPGINVTKDGEGFFIYANDASHPPYNNDGSTSFVGIAVASHIFISGDQRLLYYMVLDTQKARFYTGYANMKDDSVTWSDGTQTRLGGAIQVTSFTEGALSSLVYDYKPGDFIPFYTGNVTASASNQFPESGVFNGFISMGSNEGDYFQIFAFKTGGGGKAFSGSCIGSTTTWTELGGGGGNVIHGEDITEGLEYLIPENVGDVVAFRSTMVSSQVPAEQEGFGFLAKVNGSESMAMMMQNDPAGGGKMKFFMGRVQNDGSGTEWQELTTGSSGDTLTRVECSVPFPVINEPFTLYKVKPGDKLMLAFYIGPGTTEVVQQGQYLLWVEVPQVGQSTLLIHIQEYSPGSSGTQDESLNINNVRANADGYEFEFEMLGSSGTSYVELHAVYKLP